MKVLVIKMSSMGDVLHTLPAISDAQSSLPDLTLDWVVEPGFAEIPGWHLGVNRIITLPLRQCRKKPFSQKHLSLMQAAVRAVRAQQYDWVLDAQGLFKSALLSALAHGPRAGLDHASAREGRLASMFYTKRCAVARQQHAVMRLRLLFASALGYTVPDTQPDFGLSSTIESSATSPYVVWITGSSWGSKQWPNEHWKQLIALATDAGYRVLLPWGRAEEYTRVCALSDHRNGVTVCPKMGLTAVKDLLASASGVVSGDTGLGHLSSALNVPTVMLYGATDASLTGPVSSYSQTLLGDKSCAPCLRRQCQWVTQENQDAPCMLSHTPEQVWQRLGIGQIAGDLLGGVKEV